MPLELIRRDISLGKKLCIGILLISAMLLSVSIVLYMLSKCNRDEKPWDTERTALGDVIPNEDIAKTVADAIVEHYFEIYEEKFPRRWGGVLFNDFVSMTIFDEQLNEWTVHYWYVNPEPALDGRSMAISLRRDNGRVTHFGFGGEASTLHWTEEFFEEMGEITDRVRRERFQ